MHDTLGDRCKARERAACGDTLPRTGWISARLDGRGFSKRTQNLAKPYDPRLARALEDAARFVMADMRAVLAYHQSDEISLFWAPAHGDEERPFGGRVEKWLSLLASGSSAALMRALDAHGLSDMADAIPSMDARVHACTLEEAAEDLVWRAQDARRNAIQGAAQRLHSQRVLHGQPQAAMLDMLAKAGQPFSGFPEAYRNGTLLHHQTRQEALGEYERMAIPAHARPDAGATFARRSIVLRSDWLPDDLASATALLHQLNTDALAHRALRACART